MRQEVTRVVTVPAMSASKQRSRVAFHICSVVKVLERTIKMKTFRRCHVSNALRLVPISLKVITLWAFAFAGTTVSAAPILSPITYQLTNVVSNPYVVTGSFVFDTVANTVSSLSLNDGGITFFSVASFSNTFDPALYQYPHLTSISTGGLWGIELLFTAPLGVYPDLTPITLRPESYLSNNDIGSIFHLSGSVTPLPEPTTFAAVLLGAMGLIARKRWRRLAATHSPKLHVPYQFLKRT